MKKFIIQLFIFILFPLLFFGINSLTNLYIYTNTIVKLENRNILIIGDSHTKTSLDPKLFTSAQNISQSSEPYVLTFWKLKKIIDSYKPDTLVIGFAPHNISSFNDLKFSNKIWSEEMFKRSYTIEKFDEIDNKVKVDYLEFYKTIWKQIGFYPKKNHIRYIGSYNNNSSSNISDFKSAIKRHYYFNGKKLNFSNTSINYLDSIITICKVYNITPILVSNPVHTNYMNDIPIEIIEKYKELMLSYKSIGILQIDKTNEIYPDSLFLNSDHLNSLGSSRFTNEVINLIGRRK